MKRTNRLTEGNILHTLICFAVPVFFTLFLQALYGGVVPEIASRRHMEAPPEACSCPP